MKKKHQVAETYNIIADWFDAHRDKSQNLERKIIEMVEPYLAPDTLSLLCSYVKANGLLVFTSGPAEGEVWSENGGENLFHASLSPEAYKSILTTHGFDILFHQAEDPDCGGATVWVAQRQG